MALIRLNNSSLGAVTAAGIPTLSSANMPTGSVLQVKQTVFKGQFNTTITTAGHEQVCTGLNCTITPTSSSNKILVQYSIHMGCTTGYDNGINVYRNVTANSGAHPLGTKLLDSGGNAIEGTRQGNRPPSTGNFMPYSGADDTYRLLPVGLLVLDHPNSTSALTYSIAFRNYSYTSSSYIFINRSHRFQESSTADLYDNCPVSTITLTEIAG